MSDKDISSQVEHEELANLDLQPERTNAASTVVEEDEDYEFGITQVLAFCVGFPISFLMSQELYYETPFRSYLTD